MFKMALSSAKLWRNIIEAASELIDEATFVAKSDGLHMRSMDPSHVAMIEVTLPSTFFDEYVCDGEVKIGLNLDEFKKLLKRASASDRLEMEISERGRLTIRFAGKALRTFKMPLMDIPLEELPSPSLDFNVYARLISDVLKDAIKDANVISDYVKFIAEGDSLMLSASGDRGDVEVKLSEDMGSLVELEVKEASASTYSLSYLSDMMRAASTTDIVSLQFSSDMPLKLEFELPAEGRITYYLAPRIES
ncbi:MAG: proliferating cell nuclear antigen (pcna) [archaeon GB-1867-097]|nr:proliferating cell nuclear antigen (pcna) [Candidatus Culexmicrobium thermophilum]HDO19934.1 proliferating cell nuclear antigen (pcna) [Candidatus Bathyarchaeota archaeon]